MHREQRIEQDVPIAVVFVGLGFVPLAHQQGDTLLVSGLRGRSLLLRFFDLEPIEQSLGLVANGFVDRDFECALQLLLGQLDRPLREIGLCFFDALARDFVGAALDLVGERCLRPLGRCSEGLFVSELGRAVVACRIECVRFLLEPLGVGGEQFLQ